jgi:hypothetical protein
MICTGRLSREDLAVHIKCLCCGQGEVFEAGAYEICGICGWEDDPVQSRHRGMAGGANEPSLDDARRWWGERRTPLPVIGDFPAGGVRRRPKLP